jgi:hypothetical protein
LNLRPLGYEPRNMRLTGHRPPQQSRSGGRIKRGTVSRVVMCRGPLPRVSVTVVVTSARPSCAPTTPRCGAGAPSTSSLPRMRPAWLQRTPAPRPAPRTRSSRSHTVPSRRVHGRAWSRSALRASDTPDALRRVQTGITAQCPGGLTDQRPNATCLAKTTRAHVTKSATSGPAAISATGSLCDRAETNQQPIHRQRDANRVGERRDLRAATRPRRHRRQARPAPHDAPAGRQAGQHHQPASRELRPRAPARSKRMSP